MRWSIQEMAAHNCQSGSDLEKSPKNSGNFYKGVYSILLKEILEPVLYIWKDETL